MYIIEKLQELIMIQKKKTKQELRLEEQKRLFKNKVVVQKNDFIQGNTSIFTVNDLKIFKLIISKVKSQETLFNNFYEINTDEVKALNINETHLHKETVNSLKKLANIYINIEKEGEDPREVGLIRNDFKFPKYSKKILITFNEDMREYLLDIKGNYTKYSLIDIVNFKLKHTLKLYEYLKSVDLNVMKIKIETLKDKLDLVGKYEAFPEFKRRVLEPSIEEINEKTETLNVTYTAIKDGRKVVMIVFHIQRFDPSDILQDEKEKGGVYSHLINEECLYLDKYYILKSVEVEENTIVLEEVGVNNTSNIMVQNKEQLDQTLKSLFGDKYDQKIIDVEMNADEDNEIEDLHTIKDFKKFKSKVIEQYREKELLNNAPNFHEDTIIKIDENGLLMNGKTEKIMTKEESYEIWKYLYKNRDKVGVLAEVTFPLKKFVNEKVFMPIKSVTGSTEYIEYKIQDIKEESKDQYRLYLQDIFDADCIEKSKSLLNYQQVEQFIKTSSIKQG